MKKNINSALVFIINLLLMVVVALVIKDQDRKRLEANQEATIESAPVSGAVSDTQNAIATDRENKLRDLNNTPTSQKTTQITTTNTTTTTPSTSTKKTKTS